MVNKHLNTWLESAILPWKPFYRDVGLCLHFKFQLPTKFLSSLKVFIKTSQKSILIWKLRGFQGDKWNNAKVSWKPQENSQVNGLFYFLVSVVLKETVLLCKSNVSLTFCHIDHNLSPC